MTGIFKILLHSHIRPKKYTKLWNQCNKFCPQSLEIICIIYFINYDRIFKQFTHNVNAPVTNDYSNNTKSQLQVCFPCDLKPWELNGNFLVFILQALIGCKRPSIIHHSCCKKETLRSGVLGEMVLRLLHSQLFGNGLITLLKLLDFNKIFDVFNWTATLQLSLNEIIILLRLRICTLE